MKTAKQPHIISVTGTKGKSTVVYVLSHVLTALENTLRVDTTGYYINGEQKGTLESTKRVSLLVPTVCPGRFLTAMQDVDEFTAVLECSLGCSNAPGLGYKVHDVGVFTNVFEDHMGSTARLNSKADIAEAKRFIFDRIHPTEGYAVFNADDELVCSELKYVPDDVKLIPAGLNFKYFDIKKHVANGGVVITVADDYIVLRDKNGDTPLVSINNVSWTFKGAFQPSIYNLMLVAGALYGRFNGAVPKEAWKLLEDSRLDPNSGRLTLLKSNKGVTIIADYAHEKNSLSAVGDLAKNLASDGGKVIGVVRLAYDRSDALIKDTAKTIAPHFDEFIVYDKIDGHWRQPKPTIGKFKMVAGYISKVFSEALEQYAPTTRIIREDEAIAQAAKIAQPGDTVVIIVNDNIKRSIQFIKDEFKAELV